MRVHQARSRLCLGSLCQKHQHGQSQPLDAARISATYETTDATLIVDLIVVHYGEDTYWDDEARNLIAALILYVVHDMPEH